MEKKRQVELKLNILPRVAAVLVTMNNYFVAVAFCVILCGSLGAQRIQVGSLGLFVCVPFIFYFLRCVCKKILMFIGGHLLTAILWGVILTLGKNAAVEWIVYSVILLIYIGVSFYLKSKTEDGAETPIHPAIMVVLLLAGFWILDYVDNQQFQPFLLVLIVAFLGIYFAHYYLENYIAFVKVNKISAGKFQGKKLFRSGGALVGGYLFFSVVLLLFFTNPAMGNALGVGIKKIFLWLLKLFLSLFRGGSSEEQPIVEEAVEENMMPMDEEWGNSEPGLLAQIVDKILEVFFFLIFAVAIIAAVRWIVQKLQEMLRGHEKVIVIEGESSIQDITEQLDRDENRQKKQSIFYGLSINARIRKTYAKFMQGHKKRVEEALKQSISCSTARETISVFEKRTTENDSFEMNKMMDIKEIYEKARYSQEECTASEFRSMKKGLSKVRE